jgi:hypothetical protein
MPPFSAPKAFHVSLWEVPRSRCRRLVIVSIRPVLIFSLAWIEFFRFPVECKLLNFLSISPFNVLRLNNIPKTSRQRWIDSSTPD